MELETEDSTERPVVSVFLTMELGIFKATTKVAGVDLCKEDSVVFTRFFALQRAIARNGYHYIFWGSDVGCVSLVHSEMDREMTSHLQSVACWCGNKRSSLSTLRITSSTST